MANLIEELKRNNEDLENLLNHAQMIENDQQQKTDLKSYKEQLKIRKEDYDKKLENIKEDKKNSEGVLSNIVHLKRNYKAAVIANI